MSETRDDPDPAAALARLQRATDALARGERLLTPRERRLSHRSIALGGLGLSVALGATSIGQPWLLVPAVIVGLVGALALWETLGGGKDPTRAHVGMGASVGEGARLEPGSRVGTGATVGKEVVLEPGAAVGMGASVGEGAVLRRDARVKAGASVAAGAVLEAGAVVGSGADVGQGATVAEGARVGAGATVGRNAYVPPGTVVRAGTTWNNTDRGTGPTRGPGHPPLPDRADPRAARIDASCERLEREIRQAPPQAREYLGASLGTVRALRETCRGLLGRELALRAEVSPEAMAELEEERAVLQRRLEAATDEHVKGSLASAVAAMDDQKRQRALMARTADRLDAELTRLLWTMDGMGAQLVRLRTAGAELSAFADQETASGVKKLQDEIGAIADALEEIAADRHAELAPVSEVGGDGQPGRLDGRRRERD